MPEGGCGLNQTCMINFIEHNKQRIKLMSANSKSRAENHGRDAEVYLNPSLHHQHSQSTSNLNLLMAEA